MKLNNTLLFCGNSSIDRLATSQGLKDVIGGSACNSAVAAIFSGSQDVALLSSVGYDFPLKTLEDIGINTKNITVFDKTSNVFMINEKNSTVSLLTPTYLPIKIPSSLKVNHLHISCRKGVPFHDAFDKIQANTYSLDVMWSSVKDFLPELSTCFKKANFLFCNDDEYEVLHKNGVMEKLPEKLAIFITDKTGVTYQKGKYKKHFTTVKTSPIVSTVGAGDTFLGAFLANYQSNNNNLIEAVYKGLAMASTSIKDFGNLHLKNRANEIIEAEKTIQNMEQQNDAKFNIHCRTFLQR